MANIQQIQLHLVNLDPKVKRTDAIQSFVTQETPIVSVIDEDGQTGIGYTYTIGTGGSSVFYLLKDHLLPQLIGRDAEDIESIWKGLHFQHATAVGAITSLALAAVEPPFGICAASGLDFLSGNLLEEQNLKFQSTAQKVVGSTSRLLILCKMPLTEKLRALAAVRSKSALLMSQKMSSDYKRYVKR